MKPSKDIEIAAQRMLDAAGPEQVARFLASYDDDPLPPPLPPSAERVPDTPQVIVEHPIEDEREDEQDPFDSWLGGIRNAIETRGEKMTAEDKSLAVQLVEEYLTSDAFKRQIDVSALKRVTLALQRLDRMLHDRRLDFDHGIDLGELKELLTRNTEIKISIPMTKMRKGLDKPFEITTTYPLTTEKRHALCYLIDCLRYLAAIAHILKSESERDFKDAYVFTLGKAGGPRASQEDVARPFDKKDADKLVAAFAHAYKVLFADGSVADTCREMGEEA